MLDLYERGELSLYTVSGVTYGELTNLRLVRIFFFTLLPLVEILVCEYFSWIAGSNNKREVIKELNVLRCWSTINNKII